LDSVYAPIVHEDEAYYYIDLKKPKDVYDKVLVIDAGHGGKDAGALSQGEKYYEKNINLGILLELKKLLDKENIKVYYTRTGDDKVFLKPREELANAVDCDYFISIHCNASEAEWPKGSEVMYYDREFKGVRNIDLANLFLDELSKTTPLETRYIVEKKKDEIYILKKAVVPSILIEVGYVTNNSDMKYLSQEKNRKAAAQGIYNGIMKAYEMYPPTDDGQ
jgi:N-acetylmuramoyl-L-alanine amidase